jgi:hypothetical protein
MLFQWRGPFREVKGWWPTNNDLTSPVSCSRRLAENNAPKGV